MNDLPQSKKFLASTRRRAGFARLGQTTLSEIELDQLIGSSDYKRFLNPRNELYRTKNMGEKPPTRAEAIKLMAKTPNLIRRPVVIRGDQIVLGYDEEAFRKLLKI